MPFEKNSLRLFKNFALFRERPWPFARTVSALSYCYHEGHPEERIGSTTTKVVLIEDFKFIGKAVRSTGADIEGAYNSAIDAALKSCSRKRADIGYVVATGYGRRGVNQGNETVTEISANARGAYLLNPKTRTILDVGGQDTKVISLDDKGAIKNFLMNDKCAAGTGRFIEVIARVMQLPLEEFSRMSLASQSAMTINSTCTVFAESEVISLIAQKAKKEDIVKGIHRSIAKRISEMIKQMGKAPMIFFDGGGARNQGLKKEIEELLGLELYVPEDPVTIAAIGAAMIAQERLSKKK